MPKARLRLEGLNQQHDCGEQKGLSRRNLENAHPLGSICEAMSAATANLTGAKSL
jgi:hypothetical protein